GRAFGRGARSARLFADRDPGSGGDRGDTPSDGERSGSGRGVATAENPREDKGPCRLRAAFSTSRPIAKNSWKRRSGCRRTPSSSTSRIPCPPPRKPMPAPACAHTRRNFPGNRVWVRVNGLDSGLANDDVDAIIGVAGLAGIFLPKVDTRDEVMRWVDMIGAIERGRGVTPGATKLVLSIESARRAQRLRHGYCGRARGVADLRRRAGRRSQHRSWLRLVDRRPGNAARALAPLAGGARRALRHAARRRVRECARRGGLRARYRAVAPARLSRAQADSSFADRTLQPALPAERGRARLLRARAGGVRPSAGAGQRLDHRRRPHDRRGDGERRAPGLGSGRGAEKGGAEWAAGK